MFSFYGCKSGNAIPQIIYIHDTINGVDKVVDETTLVNKPKYDSIAKAYQTRKIRPLKNNIESGDTVTVDVTEHGASLGIVRAIRGSEMYIDYFQCNCNGWYSNYEIHPYSATWNQIERQ